MLQEVSEECCEYKMSTQNCTAKCNYFRRTLSSEKITQMKSLILLLTIMVLFASCKKTDEQKDTNLTGKWKMTAVLMDPGDGSGTFQPVSTNKYIEFRSDGTISSNGSLCSNSTESNAPDSGTWSLTDSTITSSQCNDNLPLKIRFIHEGSTLTINYPCIEPCRAKFRKM